MSKKEKEGFFTLWYKKIIEPYTKRPSINDTFVILAENAIKRKIYKNTLKTIEERNLRFHQREYLRINIPYMDVKNKKIALEKFEKSIKLDI